MRRLRITDASPGMLEHSWLWGRFGAELIGASAELLPFEDDSFDLLVASLGDPYNNRRFWLEAKRILKDGGQAIMTMPSHGWAERYRQSEGIGSTESAVFTTESGHLALPSFIPNEDAQRCLIESCGLRVNDFVGNPRFANR